MKLGRMKVIANKKKTAAKNAKILALFSPQKPLKEPIDLC